MAKSCLIAITIVWLTCGALSAEGNPKPAVSPSLISLTQQSIHRGQLEEADARLQVWLDRGETTGIPESLFEIARGHYRKKDWNESLRRLQRIVKDYPDHRMASMAMLGMGEVYGQIGDKRRMVEWLERGISAPRVQTNLDIMDASDTRNRSYQLLGKHHIDEQQWEQATEVYRAWKPRSWCGACSDRMEADRSNRIIYCLIQQRQPNSAIRECVRRLRSQAYGNTEIPLFVLTRLYTESDQAEELGKLSNRLVADAIRLAKGHEDEERRYAWLIEAQQQRKEAIARALELLSSRDWEVHIQVVLQDSRNAKWRDLAAFERRVAEWTLIENAAVTASILADHPKKDRLLHLTWRMRSHLPVERQKTLAVHANQLQSEDTFEGRFLEAWPATRKGSLLTVKTAK